MTGFGLIWAAWRSPGFVLVPLYCVVPNVQILYFGAPVGDMVPFGSSGTIPDGIW